MRVWETLDIYVSFICMCFPLLASPFGSLALASVPLITIISGVRLALPSLIFIGIGMIGLVILLVCLNLWNKRLYPLTLYLISLSLLLGTTLTSNYIIGSDIHIEYFFARLTQLQDGTIL